MVRGRRSSFHEKDGLQELFAQHSTPSSEKKAAPGAGAAGNTVSGFLRWGPGLRECLHQLIESRIDRIHADHDPNAVARVFIHPAVVGFPLVGPVDVPGNNALLVTPIGFQVASLFESGVML